jgi:hypothetical protein
MTSQSEPEDIGDDTERDDHWIDDNTEEVLASHEPSCIAAAVEDAHAHGTDNRTSARQVAAQLLEDGHSPCLCTRQSQT